MNPLDWLLDLIFPPRCPFCEKLLQLEETGICRKCRSALPETEKSHGMFYGNCWSVLPYIAPYDESLRRYKFRGRRYYAESYGELLAMMLLRENVEFDVLTWAPVSKKRKKERGFDQAEVLCRVVAGALGVPYQRTLQKTRDIPPQSSQKSEEARRANVMNAYVPVAPEQFVGKHVLLLDDIVTTGATLTECSRVLLTAGAAQVDCATVAATQQTKKKKQ